MASGLMLRDKGITLSPSLTGTDTNRMAVNNLVFFTGLRIAANKGFTHVLILEHDCRVGTAGWDEIIWQEFLSKNPEAIMGGSLVAFNPCSFSRKGAALVVSRRLRPMATTDGADC